jgi:hypothetical protein
MLGRCATASLCEECDQKQKHNLDLRREGKQKRVVLQELSEIVKMTTSMGRKVGSAQRASCIDVGATVSKSKTLDGKK